MPRQRRRVPHADPEQLRDRDAHASLRSAAWHTGPYPNETQANAALASAMPVSLEQLVQDRVDVGGPSPVKLDLGVGAELLRRGPFACVGRTLGADAPQWLKEVGPPSATLYQNQCLIL